jgi:uncharacterized protein (TIGR01244 family)
MRFLLMTGRRLAANLFAALFRSRTMSSSAALAELAPGICAAGNLDQSDIEALAASGVRTIVNNRPDGEDRGQLEAAEARRIAEGLGLAYHHIPVTMASLSQADVDAFAAVLASSPTPIVAYCRSGTRCALLWGLARMRDGVDPGTLVADAARGGIDIAALPAFAARLG